MPDAAAGSGAVAPPRPRRRGRTALLIVGAAVLGLVSGTCGGYLVQADREPTKLPPLSQPTLAQGRGDGPERLSAAQDHQVKTDGDLRKLLLKMPRGAKKADWIPDDGWIDLAAYTERFTKPRDAFPDLVGKEFRRAVDGGWQVGDTYSVEIELVQFRQHEETGAEDSSDNGQYWADEEDHTDSWSIPGTGDGMAYVHTKPDTKPGYLPMYSAEAHAWRGDIAMEIWIYDSKPIPKKTIMDLAKRQMEQL
ncbi:hypothetical protein ACFV5G_19725 [Streptomyces sp. NPDC059766]|uniref:hypothetical protein n=1 Tax=Streptomyces sp. NPDC059766 TaxID=3346940 RepID=UPI00364950EC